MYNYIYKMHSDCVLVILIFKIDPKSSNFLDSV